MNATIKRAPGGIGGTITAPPSKSMAHRAVLFNESHEIAADMPVEALLEDAALLRRVNLIDEFYHKHEGAHAHFHIHP